MKGATPGYWALVAVTVALYGTMLFWTLPSIRAEAGGLMPFDLRLVGYTLEDARAFLMALSDEGRALYGGTQAHLDALAPPLLFATLSIALWHLSPHIRKTTRYMIIIVAGIGMAADAFENAAIRDMLIAGADGVDAALVDQASLLTVAKAAANLASFIVLGFLLIRSLRKPPTGEDGS